MIETPFGVDVGIDKLGYAKESNLRMKKRFLDVNASYFRSIISSKDDFKFTFDFVRSQSASFDAAAVQLGDIVRIVNVKLQAPIAFSIDTNETFKRVYLKKNADISSRNPETDADATETNEELDAETLWKIELMRETGTDTSIYFSVNGKRSSQSQFKIRLKHLITAKYLWIDEQNCEKVGITYGKLRPPSMTMDFSLHNLSLNETLQNRSSFGLVADSREKTRETARPKLMLTSEFSEPMSIQQVIDCNKWNKERDHFVPVDHQIEYRKTPLTWKYLSGDVEAFYFDKVSEENVQLILRYRSCIFMLNQLSGSLLDLKNSDQLDPFCRENLTTLENVSQSLAGAEHERQLELKNSDALSYLLAKPSPLKSKNQDLALSMGFIDTVFDMMRIPLLINLLTSADLRHPIIGRFYKLCFQLLTMIAGGNKRGMRVASQYLNLLLDLCDIDDPDCDIGQFEFTRDIIVENGVNGSHSSLSINKLVERLKSRGRSYLQLQLLLIVSKRDAQKNTALQKTVFESIFKDTEVYKSICLKFDHIHYQSIKVFNFFTSRWMSFAAIRYEYDEEYSENLNHRISEYSRTENRYYKYVCSYLELLVFITEEGFIEGFEHVKTYFPIEKLALLVQDKQIDRILKAKLISIGRNIWIHRFPFTKMKLDGRVFYYSRLGQDITFCNRSNSRYFIEIVPLVSSCIDAFHEVLKTGKKILSKKQLVLINSIFAFKK